MRKNRENKYVYSIWDNITDNLIILDGSAGKCAEALGLKTAKNFYDMYGRFKRGKLKKYHIERTSLKNIELLGALE